MIINGFFSSGGSKAGALSNPKWLASVLAALGLNLYNEGRNHEMKQCYAVNKDPVPPEIKTVKWMLNDPVPLTETDEQVISAILTCTDEDQRDEIRQACTTRRPIYNTGPHIEGDVVCPKKTAQMGEHLLMSSDVSEIRKTNFRNSVPKFNEYKAWNTNPREITLLHDNPFDKKKI